MIFTKMHGLGNDFVVVNGFALHLDSFPRAGFEIPPYQQLAVGICDRHFGVGGDGLILVVPSKNADFCMRMINPDGTEAQMCGNGIRCAAKFAFERGITSANPVRVDTLAGIKTIEMTIVDGKVTTARVDMGKPWLDRTEIPSIMPGVGPIISEPLAIADVDGAGLQIPPHQVAPPQGLLAVTCVSMGNPHCITFVDDVKSFPLAVIGPQVERHPSFPERTNAEFVEVISPNEIRMRVWERGAAETLACGTGACASAVASILNAKTERKVTVHLDGGDLEIEWPEDGSVFMTGPAVEVFTGELNEELLNAWINIHN